MILLEFTALACLDCYYHKQRLDLVYFVIILTEFSICFRKFFNLIIFFTRVGIFSCSSEEQFISLRTSSASISAKTSSMDFFRRVKCPCIVYSRYF